MVNPAELIHIRGPGTLVALRGQNRIATLLNGKLQDYGFNIFEASWLSHLQERFAKWVLHECFKVSVSKVNLTLAQPWSEISPASLRRT